MPRQDAVLSRGDTALDTLEISRIRGANDVVPPFRAEQIAVEAQLRALFSLYGYEPISTPILEPTDLFLRKSGEQVAARMYAFTHWNRSLCLRPEHTASVIRAFVNHLQDRALPQRLQYAGPTFRYEKPQRGRHRQFTEVGVECIGAAGPAADAEVLALARHGLDTLGIRQARFIVGHLGAVLEVLSQLGMEPRAQSLVLGVMEHLSRAPGESERLVARLAAMLGAGDDEGAPDDDVLGELFRFFGPQGAARIAGDLLERANLPLEGGSRSPAEIIERLVRKSRRPDPTPALERAVEFIGRLRDAAGPPAAALPAVRRVLTDFGLGDGPVREVEQALDCFAAYFGTPGEVRVDLSLGRGVRYYTGLVFEVYDDHDVQVAGGGRYDDLVRSLGGRAAIPAIGFSFGLERVMAAQARQATADRSSAPRAVLFVPIGDADAQAAARLATELRAAGVRVDIDLRQRGLKANLRYADHHGVPLVLFVGERERADGVVGVRDMRSREELRVPPDDLVNAVVARLAVPDPGIERREHEDGVGSLGARSG